MVSAPVMVPWCLVAVDSCEILPSGAVRSATSVSELHLLLMKLTHLVLPGLVCPLLLSVRSGHRGGCFGLVL